MANTKRIKHDWKFELPDWTKPSVQSLEFLHKLACDNFMDLYDTSQQIRNRAFTFLSILIASISLMIAFNKNLSLLATMDTCIYSIFIIIWFISAFIEFILLISLLYPYDISFPGEDLRNIEGIENFFTENFNDELQYKAIILYEIESVHDKISYAEGSNKKRMSRLRVAIVLMSFIFLFFAFVLFIFPLF